MTIIVDEFVGRCMNIVGQLIMNEVVTPLKVKDDLQRLHEKLEMIRDVLSDAERIRINDAAVNRWLSRLRDVMYDIDDVLDLCSIRGRQLHPQSPPKRSRTSLSIFSFFVSNACGFPLKQEMSREIQELNRRLDDISKDRQTLNLQPLPAAANPTLQPVRETTSPLSNFDAVGGEIKLVSERLADSLVLSRERSLLVFAIVGLGGIGKTTLARKIYNHRSVQANFQKRLWICVSKNYSETELLREMIRCAGGSHGQAQSKAELHLILTSALAGNRFLIVLDDVWHAQVWEHVLRAPLELSGASSSRVIVTTRDEDVSKSMRAIHIHHVKKLPADASWALLCKSIGDDEERLQDLRDIGMQIVAKCDGLPLALKTVGGVLRTKGRSKREWGSILQSPAWSVTSADLPNFVRGALYLSYQDLPSQLKQCFLYTALYPAGHTFHSDDLVKFWIAEGFITSPCDTLLEDTAMECYSNLISRSLLQVHPDFPDRSRCQMHDLTRSLALSLTQSECLCVDLDQSMAIISSLKLRRLAIRGREQRHSRPASLNGIKEPQILRTLHMTGCILLQKLDLENLFQRFKHLRVLDLTDTGVENIPDSIKNLLQLRYLDLDRTRVRAIPDSLRMLSSLQFLNLSGCERLHTIPESITQLSSLRCLRLVNTPISHLPIGIHKLGHLNELGGFVIGTSSSQDGHQNKCCGLDELRPMSQLRKLSIERLERVWIVANDEPLRDKNNLKELRLSCSPTENARQPQSNVERFLIERVFEDLHPPASIESLMLESYYGLNFPKWIGMLDDLRFLYLNHCSSCRNLPPLGQLPHLKFLRIDTASSVIRVGSEFLSSSSNNSGGALTFFPELTDLVLYSMANLEEWTCDVNVKLLPHLRSLKIRECPKLSALPRGLQHAASLKSCLIQGGHALREIANMPSVEELIIEDCTGIQRIEDLTALREMTISNSCRRLKTVKNLVSLQCLNLSLQDHSTGSLPQWLPELVEQGRRNGALQALNLKCREMLEESCRPGGQHWPLLSQVPEVSVNSCFL